MFKVFFYFLSFIFLLGCSKDPCEKVVCQNGGYCANGSCVCPEGYTGADCSQQKTPSIIFVTRIDLIQTPPFTSTGALWDNGEGTGFSLADPYLDLSLGGVLIYSTDFKTDISSSQLSTYTLPSPIMISSPNARHTIDVWDFDVSDSDDFMGGIEFSPYFSTNRFPSSQLLSVGGISVRLYYTYVW
jgi:hypothetical protein